MRGAWNRSWASLASAHHGAWSEHIVRAFHLRMLHLGRVRRWGPCGENRTCKECGKPVSVTGDSAGPFQKNLKTSTARTAGALGQPENCRRLSDSPSYARAGGGLSQGRLVQALAVHRVWRLRGPGCDVVNCKQKGSRAERGCCVRILEAAGYVCTKAGGSLGVFEANASWYSTAASSWKGCSDGP
jgi:hypothetical protein